MTVIGMMVLHSVLGPLLQLTDAKDKLRAVAKHLEVPEMQVRVWGRGELVCGGCMC